jgi:hypothetical protein
MTVRLQLFLKKNIATVDTTTMLPIAPRLLIRGREGGADGGAEHHLGVESDEIDGIGKLTPPALEQDLLASSLHRLLNRTCCVAAPPPPPAKETWRMARASRRCQRGR